MAVIALNRGGVIYGDPIRPLINRRINTGSIIEWGHIWPNKCKFVKKNGKSKALDEEPLFAKESGGAFAFNPGRRWECERELSQEIKCDYGRKSKERESQKNYEENRVWGKFMRSESERGKFMRGNKVKGVQFSFWESKAVSAVFFKYSDYLFAVFVLNHYAAELQGQASVNICLNWRKGKSNNKWLT